MHHVERFLPMGSQSRDEGLQSSWNHCAFVRCIQREKLANAMPVVLGLLPLRNGPSSYHSAHADTHHNGRAVPQLLFTDALHDPSGQCCLFLNGVGAMLEIEKNQICTTNVQGVQHGPEP